VGEECDVVDDGDARCRRRGCSKRKVLPNLLAGEEELER